MLYSLLAKLSFSFSFSQQFNSFSLHLFFCFTWPVQVAEVTLEPQVCWHSGPQKPGGQLHVNGAAAVSEQLPPFRHGLLLHSSTTSQRMPSHPAWQVQLKLAIRSLQVAPLKHGLLLHSLISAHVGPS